MSVYQIDIIFWLKREERNKRVALLSRKNKKVWPKKTSTRTANRNTEGGRDVIFADLDVFALSNRLVCKQAKYHWLTPVSLSFESVKWPVITPGLERAVSRGEHSPAGPVKKREVPVRLARSIVVLQSLVHYVMVWIVQIALKLWINAEKRREVEY